MSVPGYLISQLNAAAPIGGTEFIPMLQSGGPVKGQSGALKVFVNVVYDFGADPTGTTDSTAAITAAYAAGDIVYYPPGFYLQNATMGPKSLVLLGCDTALTVIQPFNPALAALTVNTSPSAWSYASEVRNIAFWGPSGTGGPRTGPTEVQLNAVGVGVAFGNTLVANYVVGMEYADNMKFYACRWLGLQKGIEYTFGNIGCELYSCGWTECYYGEYCLDNKAYPGVAGSNLMHAGNKYHWAGEFDNNVVGVYVNDNSGYGGMQFEGTIFEANFCDFYSWCGGGNYIAPLFHGVWLEASGQNNGASPATINVDVWTGNVLTTKAITPHRIVLDGGTGTYKFHGGFLTDVCALTSGITIDATECRMENIAGFGGAPCVIAAGSQLLMSRCHGNSGPPRQANCIVTDYYRMNDLSTATIDDSPTNASCKGFIGAHRQNVVASLPTCLASETFTKAAPWSLGTVAAVSDGVLFGTCNQVSVVNMTAAQYATADSTEFETPAAPNWVVATVDVKATAGAAKLFIWNESTAQMVSGFAMPELNQWITLVAYGYSPGSQTMALSFGGPPSTQTCTMEFSAFQAHSFPTQEEALSFIASHTYGPVVMSGTVTPAPGTIANGAHVSGTVAVAGAALGDYVRGAYGADLQGVNLRTWVSSAGNVEWWLQNDTGAGVTLTSAPLTLEVTQT